MTQRRREPFGEGCPDRTGHELSHHHSIVNDQTGIKLGAKAYPAGAGGAMDAMTFTGTGSAAKVSPNGTVTFVMKGTVTVKATAADGSKVSASFRSTEK